MARAPEEILSDLIRIDSTNPPGNETAVALYLKKLFSEAGINGRIVEPEEGRGSFIARLGSGKKKLLFLAHSDVVPAGEDWDFEPFSGEIKNGVVHGRGALDCKDLIAAQASAALQLLEEKFPFAGELIVAATADEERGGRLGVGYLTAEMPELLRADFAVNEGADQPITVNGKMVYFLQIGEKGAAWCRLKTRGRAGHGSIPSLADNAVVKMARVVDRLSRYRPETVLIPEVEKLIHSLADLCAIKSRVLSPDRVDRLLDKLLLEKAFVEALRSMTRMTVSPNVIQGGSKTNIVPDYCEAEIDIRTLPGQGAGYVEEELRPLIGSDTELEFTENVAASFSSSAEPFYKLMEEVTLDLAGEKALCLPVISAGGTDSKFLRGLGIPSYGIGHMAEGFDQQLRTTVHGRNERIDIRSLHLKTAFLKETARRYLG